MGRSHQVRALWWALWQGGHIWWGLLGGEDLVGGVSGWVSCTFMPLGAVLPWASLCTHPLAFFLASLSLHRHVCPPAASLQGLPIPELTLLTSHYNLPLNLHIAWIASPRTISSPSWGSLQFPLNGLCILGLQWQPGLPGLLLLSNVVTWCYALQLHYLAMAVLVPIVVAIQGL